MNEDKTNKSMYTWVGILVAICALLALYFLFFYDTSNNNNLDLNNELSGNTNTTSELGTATDQDITIEDMNAKSIYDRIKSGITLNGKLIELPASYMKKLTNKVTKAGYTLADDTKAKIDDMLDEAERIIREDGADNWNDFKDDTKSRLKGISNNIESML